MINRLNHVGVLVSDLEDAKRFLSDVLGLELRLERAVPALRRNTAFFGAGEVEIELIEPLDLSEKARVLGQAAAMIEHIALDVNDLVRAVETLAVHGVQIRGDGIVRVGGRDHAWTEPSTSAGIMYQLSADILEK